MAAGGAGGGQRLDFWFTAWRRELYSTLPKLAVDLAVRAERQAWSGMWVIDSQNLAGDPYASLALAARETDKIEMGPGVTNPYTRHPAVTASAIATIQEISDGRAVLGIGRGDSALGFLGAGPAPFAVFRRYLDAVQAYLRGDSVPFEPERIEQAGLVPFARAQIGHAPEASRIEWLDPEAPKVPMDVAATGPKVIALAARISERISISVGADPARIAWAIDIARTARREAGLDPAGLSIGVFVNLVVTDDKPLGREMLAPALAGFARFSAMHGKRQGPLDAEQRAVIERIGQSYSMGDHGKAGSAQMNALTDGFIDSFGVVGSTDHCIERLRQIAALGVDRVSVMGPCSKKHRLAEQESDERFVTEVMPSFRGR